MILASYSTLDYSLRKFWLTGAATQKYSIFHKVEDIPGGPFRSDGWYEAVFNKIKFLTEVVAQYEFVIFSDSDISFLGSIEPIVDYHKSTFCDISFMREGKTEEVNTGFMVCEPESLDFFTRCLDFSFKEPFGDQTVINNLLKRSTISYSFIPDRFVTWGPNYVKGSLIHHPVCCSNTEEKAAQITKILRICS